MDVQMILTQVRSFAPFPFLRFKFLKENHADRQKHNLIESPIIWNDIASTII